MMRVSVIAVFVGVFACVIAQESPNPCLGLSTCMRRAQEKFEECQGILENREERPMNPHRPGNEARQCREELKELFLEKKNAHEEKSQQFQSCIERRLEDMDSEDVPVGGRRKCERRTERIQERIQRRQRRREGRVGNRRRFGRMNGLKQCMEEVKGIKGECRQLAGCCSEAPICHLEYETSEIHDTIKGLQLGIILTRRECKKIKGALQGDVLDSDVLPTDLVVDADL
jgi:hypothetical protein